MENNELDNALNECAIFVIDRFEEDFAVCEKQDTEEMVNIERKLIPENVIEGMTIKKCDNIYVIDYENCIVTRKLIIDNLKNNWLKEDGTEYYIVSSILDTAVKCSNIFVQENIFIKDEEIASSLKKGNIIKLVDGKYILDEEKNLEVENEIQKLL